MGKPMDDRRNRAAHGSSARRAGMTPGERSLRGRMAAYRMHALHDPRDTTHAARAAFAQRFVDEVDPKRQLPERERLRRADAARRAYFTRLAYLAARRRRTLR